MAEAKTTEKKPRVSKLERLERELAEARAAEAERAAAKRANYQGQLDNALEQKARIEERIATIEANLAALPAVDETDEDEDETTE